MNALFQDRREAGRLLAASLTDYAHRDGCLVLGLDSGAVPVALEVAHALNLPLERYPAATDVVKKRCILLVAEGILRSDYVKTAVEALQQQEIRRIVIASPVASQTGLAELWPLVSDVFFLTSPPDLQSLNECYQRLPAFPTREADELITLHRNQQYLEPASTHDLVQLKRAQDGAKGNSHRGNSRTSAKGQR